MTVVDLRGRGERTPLYVDIPFTKAPTTASGDLELSGYASTWGLDRDDEMVAKDAFDKSLGAYLSKNPMVLWQHNMDWPIGTVSGGHTDENGLFVTALIPNPGPNAADWQKGAYTAIKTGVVRTFSIGGYMKRDVKAGPDGPVFVIAEVELLEIACVSIPANADSIYEAAIKALNGERPRLAEKAASQMEQLLGFKSLADPELAAMGPDDRRERYDMLSKMFERAYGAEAPGYDSFRKVSEAIQAGVSPLKTAPAVSMVAKAFYSPVEGSLEEKAGRSISAANRTKLEGAAEAHEELVGHMIDAAESMKAAAKAHDTANGLIKDVLGLADEEPDPDDDQREDEQSGGDTGKPEESSGAPKKAVDLDDEARKALASQIQQALRDLGVEKFGQAAGGLVSAGPAPFVFVDDFDPDEQYAIFGVWGDSPADDTFWKVPYLSGSDGSLALGDDATEVEQVTTWQPKSALGLVQSKDHRDLARSKAPNGHATKTAADEPPRPPTPETPDPKPGDVGQKGVMIPEEADEDLDAAMAAQADFQKELHVLAGSLKAAGLSVDAKAALALANLPLADRDRSWDSAAAKARVIEWAERDAGKLEKAFLWRDPDGQRDDPAAYKFLLTDVVDEKLVYVPKAILAAGHVVKDARGGVSDEIATAIKPKVKTLYGRLAKKLGDDSITVPWSD